MADAELNDEQLLAAARRGDRTALEGLLRRYQTRIYGYGLRMCGDPDDAKDVLQETMLALARRVEALQAAAALPTWLYAVARSFCIKRHTRGGPRPQSFDEARAAGQQFADPGRGPEERLAGRELEAALTSAIAGLSQKERDVLVLRDIEGLSAEQVGAILGLRVGAVKSRLHRARETLRIRLAPAFGEGPRPAFPGSMCPDVLGLWSRHREGEITADMCAEMEEHVARCPSCAAACDSLKRTLAVCQSATTPHVPEEVQQSVRDALDRFVPA